MLKEFRVCPLSVEIDLSVAAPSIEFKDPFDLKGTHSSSQQVNIVKVIHCEGETKWITASSRHYKRKSCYALGYKNNKSYRNYKILRFLDGISLDYYIHGSGWMELWVTNNFYTEAAALLWSKSFTVDLHVLEERFPFSPAFLLNEEKKWPFV
ncbi:hypothetical protein F2Q68_00034811 [Brassica cretica]|uniref:F-box associated beta-propeller type 1 domain-containing protein n=1 Tax=Brassica cretica TaxID=69181 RepID=A0A8S9GY72_BRACR|nr:hypothetical protein F2Q68_00034811 [Brassica cretica]